MIENLNKLKDRCKGDVTLSINEHRSSYMPVSEYLECFMDKKDIEEEIPLDIYNKMVELDTMVVLYLYPDNTVGGYHIHHYDIEQAIKEGIKVLGL